MVSASLSVCVCLSIYLAILLNLNLNLNSLLWSVAIILDNAILEQVHFICCTDLYYSENVKSGKQPLEVTIIDSLMCPLSDMVVVI